MDIVLRGKYLKPNFTPRKADKSNVVDNINLMKLNDEVSSGSVMFIIL